VDEAGGNPGAAGTGLSDIVADPRKLDRVRGVADQLRDVAAQRGTRDRIELPGQHQGGYPAACRDEGWGTELGPGVADAIELQAIEDGGVRRKGTTEVRAVAASHGGM